MTPLRSEKMPPTAANTSGVANRNIAANSADHTNTASRLASPDFVATTAPIPPDHPRHHRAVAESPRAAADHVHTCSDRLGAFGGFQFEVLDQTGSSDINTLAGATFGMMGAANQSGKVMGAFSSFRADDPQLIVDIDRDKARSLGLPLREVTDALQVFLGSQYVNDFDFNNRAYRVYVQADQRFRASPANLKQLYARASNGDMIPLDSVVRLRETTAPQVISHFNLFRSAEITGNPAPGQSSGQTLQAMEDLARANLPPGFRLRVGGAVARRAARRRPGRA